MLNFSGVLQANVLRHARVSPEKSAENLTLSGLWLILDVYKATSKNSMRSDCAEIFSSDDTKSAGNTLCIAEHFWDI